MNRALFASLLIIGTALAQDRVPAPPPNSSAASNDADTPNRAVARISVINGVVSVRRGDSGEAVAAALNAPLTSADRLLTGDGSRAEIQFDAANMIRLAPDSEVRLGDLAYHRYQVEIAAGTTIFRILRDTDAQVEISTPSMAVRPLKKGVYRITVNPDGTSDVTVRSGEAEIASPKGNQKLAAGKTMKVRGNSENPEFQVTAAIPQDAFEKWNLDRDRDLEKSESGRYVNPDINGTEELDANGRWVNDPAYGQVWVPTVDPGWAPYRVGRWVWIDYYGWTWVSADPWGWAPYHYGRWYLSAYGWAWWPGAVYGPYYWRPALVGFFGWGGPGFGVGFGFGFGNVGWVALAPYERFNAWYGPGIYGRGFGAVAMTRNVNVANIYRNARVANGVTSMSSSQFGRTGVNGANYVHATSADLARAGAVRGAVAIAPSRESTHFSNASAGAVHASENSHFYSSRPASPAANRVSFDQQRQAMTRAAAAMNSPVTHAGAASAVRSAGPPSGSSSGNTSAISRGPAAPASNPSNSSAGSSSRFSGGNSSASQPVRVNPSVVRSRGSSAPSGASRGGGSRGGGGRR